ncbi:Ig-like domain-containing protein [uncultured Methanolobus sp.]|uniref:Ig-like domain-containing protein n=1 Tax=uncultured Methanolobus sp. TaxID=218300 RepID=UPI0029C8CCF1|nr:PGF-pre-PGF domain-containing protein [uncultured Methanolobus sp.]
MIIASAASGDSENIIISTGNFWVLHDWDAGATGDVTDSYNVSCNGIWYNETLVSELNHTDLAPHSWSNITVYAYNTTSSTLSSGISNSVQLPNNDIYITDVASSISVIEGATIHVDANFTDLDGDVPVFDCDRPDLFEDFDSSNGIGNWKPKHKDAGTHYVEFSVSDGYNSSDSHVMVISVNEVVYTPAEPVNFINSTGNFWVLHGWQADTTGDFTDSYNVSYNGIWYNSTESEFNNTDLSAHGWSNITVYAYNATSPTLSSGVPSNVQLPNNLITISDVSSSVAISEDDTLYIDANFTDLDGDVAVFYCDHPDLFADFDTSTGIGSWTTDYFDNGTYSVNFSVSDGHGSIASQVMEITVTNLNREPVLNDITSKTISEGSPLEFTIVATDPDDEDIEFQMSGLPSEATLNASTGEFSWTPDYDKAREYTAHFVVSDGEYSDEQFVTIVVENTNRGPILDYIGDRNINESEDLIISLTADDADGDDVLSYQCNATFGIFDSVNGNFTWIPNYNAEGTYYVEFVVFDGFEEDSEVVTIGVANTNRPPELSPLSDDVGDEGIPFSMFLSAIDPDEDDLTYFKDVEFGNISGNIFTWTPDYDDKGFHYINFSVTDGYLWDYDVVMIAVGETNLKPELDFIEDQAVNESETLNISLNASSPDGDPIEYFALDMPAGTVLNETTGEFTWTPDYDQSGTYTIIFGVSDGVYEDKQPVNIEVIHVNRAPSFGYIPVYTVNESEKLSFVLNVTDPDKEDVLTFSSNVSYGSISDNVFTWIPGYTANQTSNGTYNINFTVTDDGGLSDNTVVTIHVNDVNAPPELSTIGSKSVVEGNELLINLTATDVDKDILTYSVLNKPDNATFNSATGVFTWTPVASEAKTYSVIFGVTDGEYNDTETVTITVTKGPSTSSTTTSSSGGGGGGGGSLSSGEKYENILLKDYVLKAVVKDSETVFSFYKENNSIVSVSFTSKLNGGQTKAVIEMLVDTSSQVSSSAPGDVYKNMNIYVDTKLGSDSIGNSKINFKVEKGWIDDNDIDLSTITLCRYSSSTWVQLPTEMTGEDESYYYFTSTTPGFSPFAISSIVPSLIAEESTAKEAVSSSYDAEETVMSTEDAVPVESTTDTSQKSSSTLPFIYIIALIGIVVIGAFGYKKRDYYEKVRLQIGNPDGKRYRRVK